MLQTVQAVERSGLLFRKTFAYLPLCPPLNLVQDSGIGGRSSTPGEAGVLKRGANLSFVQRLSFLPVQEAGHLSEASQLPCCSSGELPDVCLVSQLAIKCDSLDLQLRQMCSVENGVDVVLDLDTISSCIFCGAKVTCHLRLQSSRRRSVVLRRKVTTCSSPGEKGSDRVT
ncbi:hypothetical protein E2C01_087177 [Portunus trituberculatus]|uniref:Uncharacterized protein n=1 Tax=Portunus trituberculatus TaxID=210409 RepID=A0A5B7JID2_PORTR|nr:hypothetical protein [Portunus trituberculatus]